jgi:hypothetical protein
VFISNDFNELLIINDFNELLIIGIGNIWKIGTLCFESRNLEMTVMIIRNLVNQSYIFKKYES